MPRANRGLAHLPEQDRRIAGLLLRNARSQAELAAEDGSTAYLANSRRAPRVDERLMRGEFAQVRSHNRRCGVDPADLPASQAFASAEERLASSLDGEFVRRAHELRACPATLASATPRKRQRVGISSKSLDLAAAKEEEARQANEDVALANPLLRPPLQQLGEHSTKRQESVKCEAACRWGCKPVTDTACHMWPSKKLRVRVVDETGEFRSSHLKKGVVRHVDRLRCVADVELDGDGGPLLHNVPPERLETVVSRGCRRVEIVRGPHCSLVAELLRRDTSCNRALVRLARQLPVPFLRRRPR